MFSRIMVPLDGSTRAERALPIAARIARASNARVLLVRAVTVPVTYGLSRENGRVRWHLTRDEREIARGYLDMAARLPELAELPVETLVATGAAASVILGACARRRVELVVLTSHGQTGALRWVLGSVASHVVHHSRVPVLLLPARDAGAAASASRRMSDSAEPGERLMGSRMGSEPGTRESLGGPDPLRVLIPLDGSPLAEAALAPAAILGRALAGSQPVVLHLLHVVTPYDEMATATPEALLVDSAQGDLSRIAQRLCGERHDEVDAGQLTVTCSVAVHGDVASAIVGTAMGTGVTAEMAQPGADVVAEAPLPTSHDLIALTTHGRSGFVRWMLGSVAERVLTAATLPLLIVRSSGASSP